MIVRFYFGAVQFFDTVHINPETEARVKTKSYGIDFGMGLIHFLVFFAWSLTITDHGTRLLGLTTFLWLLIAILLYDIIWCFVNWISKFRDTIDEIKTWTVVNFLTVLFGSLLFFLPVRLLSDNYILAEEVCFILVGAVTLVDYAEMMSMSKRKHFANWLERFINWLAKVLLTRESRARRDT